MTRDSRACNNDVTMLISYMNVVQYVLYQQARKQSEKKQSKYRVSVPFVYIHAMSRR